MSVKALLPANTAVQKFFCKSKLFTIYTGGFSITFENLKEVTGIFTAAWLNILMRIPVLKQFPFRWSHSHFEPLILFKILFCFIILFVAACQSASPLPAALPPTEPPATVVSTPSSAAAPTNSASHNVGSSQTPSNSLAVNGGGTALVGLIGSPVNLNPILENDTALRELTPLLFDTLLQVDPKTAVLQPGLAQSWEYRSSGREVVFRLPANLKWSNGDPLTAAAVAESLSASRHPALLAFSNIEALDDETLALTFVSINCSAVTALAQVPLLLPQTITATVPIGSGPFVVDDWPESKRNVSLRPNPNYHGPPPHLEGLSLRFLQADEIDIALSEGQFDLFGPIQSSITTLSSQFPNNQAPTQGTIITYPVPQVIYVAINFTPKNEEALPPQVREALVLALDRTAILAEALDNDGQVMASSLLPGHWAANSSLSPPEYDPTAAQALLRQAGLRDQDGDGWLDQNEQRLELSLRVNGQNELHQKLGWLVSSYYRAAGLFARSEGVGVDSVVDDLFTHDFRLAVFSWRILPDPDQQLYWRSTENSEGFGLNFTSYRNLTLDRLLDRANSIPGCEMEARRNIYAQIQETLAIERPVDFLIAPYQHLLVAERLRGPQPGPFAPLTWNVSEWYLAP